MELTSTRSSLVKHLYRENSAAESLAVEAALQQNYLLREAYNDLREAYDNLPKIQFRPKTSTVQKILQYSRKTALQQQP